jgi:Mg-chelatase subunit ChlD
LQADLKEMRSLAERVPNGIEAQRAEVEARIKSIENQLASIQPAMKGPAPAKQAPATAAEVREDPHIASLAESQKLQNEAPPVRQMIRRSPIDPAELAASKMARGTAATPAPAARAAGENKLKEMPAAPSPSEPERLFKSVDELLAQGEAAKGVAAPAGPSAGVAGGKNEALTATNPTTSTFGMASQAMTMPAIKSDKLAAPMTPAATPRPTAKPMEVAKLKEAKKELTDVQRGLQPLNKEQEVEQAAARSKTAAPAPVPQPEVATSINAFSTFSLNVSDVAFKLAGANLEKGLMPEPATVRSEEFINAFDYRDPEPASGAPLAFASERARYPFAQNRDLLRLSVKTAAAGRQPGRALNLVLLLDNSGSMERADRVRILREALRVLATQLQPQDKLSVVTFARTPRLWADGVTGDKAGEAVARVGEITPQGGTNLSAALDLGYATALRHYQVGSINRVVLLTDGAANLGDVSPDALKQKVESHRRQGVALDCFGIGWEGYDDSLLEALSRNGDGRYGFINSPEEAATEFAGQLAGALRVAASDVKVQVEFNPRRVTAYRQVGYAKHQLTKEQFRDNTVDAAEIGAAESGNALYVVEVNPLGEGDLATVRVRFKVPGTSDYHEHAWAVPFAGAALPLEQATPALRLAGTAGAFAEWLVASPYAGEVTTDRLLGLLNGVPAVFGADPRPTKLEWMIRQAKSVSGR